MSSASSVCAGQSLALTAKAAGGSGSYTYSWSASPTCTGCISDPSALAPSVSPQVPTLFTLTVKDSSGATVQKSVSINVSGAPVANAGPEQMIDPGSGVLLGTSGATTDTVSWSCNRSDCALSDPSSANPVALPTQSTLYTMTVTNAAGCSATSQATVWVNLRATSILPADGEMAWPISAALLVQFDQPLDPASVTADTVYLEDIDGVRIPVTATASGQYLEIKPGTGYAVGADYTLTLVGGADGLRSADGVLPNKLSANVTVSFTTSDADTAAPTIVYRLPPANSVDNPLNAVILATFDEQLDPRTVSSTSFHLSSAAGEVPGALNWNPAIQTITLDPDAYLDPNAAYTVSVDGVADLSGNALTTAWSFSTGTQLDESAPVVVAVSPADGEIGVSGNAAVVITFSEVVDARLSGSIVVNRTSDGQAATGILSFNPAMQQATWTPTDFYDSETEYRITVNGFRDLAGNVMVAPFTSTFVTRKILFSDNFNSGTDKWITLGGWGGSISRYHSPGASLADSPVGRYAPNALGDAVVAAPIDVTGLTTVSLNFWLREQTERNTDYFTAQYRLDGGAWVDLKRQAGNQPWREQAFAIDPAGASTLELRFAFGSDEKRQRDGIHVDDLLVQSP